MFAPGSVLDIFKEVLVGCFKTDEHIEQLIEAMRKNNVLEVQILLESTPLHGIIPEGIENSKDLGYEEKNRIVRTLRSLTLAHNPKIMQLLLESGARLDLLDAQLRDKPQQRYVLSRLLPASNPPQLESMHDDDPTTLKMFRTYAKFYQKPNLEMHKLTVERISIYRLEGVFACVVFAGLMLLNPILDGRDLNGSQLKSAEIYGSLLQNPGITILTNLPLFFEYYNNTSRQRLEKYFPNPLKFSNIAISYFVIQPQLAQLLQESLSKEHGKFRADLTLAAAMAFLFVYSLGHLIYVNPAIDFAGDYTMLLEQEKFDYEEARAQIPQVIESRFGEPTALLFRQRAADIRKRETEERQESRQTRANSSRLSLT